MTVINVKGMKKAQREALLADEGFVYVGRKTGSWDASPWGNPFRLIANEPRGATIERYKTWLWEQIRSGAISYESLAALDGKTLGCWCEPEPCHAHVLAAAAAWAADELAQGVTAYAGPRAHRALRYPAEFSGWAEREGLAEADRVLVAVAPGFKAAEVLHSVVAELAPGTIVIEGESPGTDAVVAERALARGLPVAGFPVRWEVQPHSRPENVRVTADGRRYDAYAPVLRMQRMMQCAPSRVVLVADADEPAGTLAAASLAALDQGIPVDLYGSDGSVRRLTQPA